jgi:hypothetical protein
MRINARAMSVAASLSALALACAGCAGAPVPAKGASGMGMGAEPAAGGMVAGVVAASRDASMSAPAFDPASGALTVSRVLAPEDGWLVVRSASAPGGVLGFAAVSKGESRDVPLRLTAIDGRKVRVALFVDRGARGVLDFDADRVGSSLDKPVFVDGAPIESTVALLGWGAEADPNTALIMVENQVAAANLDIAYLLVPAPSWIEVRRVEQGVPTERIGLLLRPAGEFHKVAVPIAGARPGDELLVTVLADQGVPGRFEPAAGDALRGVDQPWVPAGVATARRIRLK